MATLLKLVLTGTGGVLLGLLLTIVTLRPEGRGISVGPWHGAPREGAIDADPYALASIERAGTLPLGAAEGVSFVATEDGSGSSLSSRCTYTIAGTFPPARFWSLSVLTSDGFPIANPADRYAITSAELLRPSDGPAAISVGSEARSGNWLPVGAATPFVLALRLYDTGLSAAGASLDAAAMPTIDRTGCR